MLRPFRRLGLRERGKGGAGGLTACSIGLALAASAAVFFLLQRYGRKEKNRIDGLTDYLEQVNRGAPGTLLQEEDGFSCLRDEIYKTVTGLYAARDEAVRARKNFADNLANIAASAENTSDRGPSVSAADGRRRRRIPMRSR